MNRVFRIIPLLVLLSISISVLLMPSLSRATDHDKTMIIFIPDTDWPPYLINDPQYPGGGVLMEVLRAVAEPLGYKVTPERLPNKRGWYLLDQGDVHVHAKAKEWVTNPDDYLWTEPFMQHEGVLLYRYGSRIQYTGPEALYGKKLTCIKGFIYPELEEHFGPDKITRVDVTSPFAMLELLGRGRVDAAIVNKNETLWLFRNRPDLKPQRFRMDETPCEAAGYRYVFTNDKSWLPFINEFNKRIKEMKRNGELKAILDQYR